MRETLKHAPQSSDFLHLPDTTLTVEHFRAVSFHFSFIAVKPQMNTCSQNAPRHEGRRRLKLQVWMNCTYRMLAVQCYMQVSVRK